MLYILTDDEGRVQVGPDTMDKMIKEKAWRQKYLGLPEENLVAIDNGISSLIIHLINVIEDLKCDIADLKERVSDLKQYSD